MVDGMPFLWSLEQHTYKYIILVFYMCKKIVCRLCMWYMSSSFHEAGQCVRLLRYEEDLSSSPMTDHLHVVVGVSTARAGS